MEERETRFAVGDKVVMDKYYIGTVVKITPARKDIVVQFDNFKERFNCDGLTNSGYIKSYIQHWTPELQKRIDDRNAVANCKRLWNDVQKYNKLTPDTARETAKLLEACLKQTN